MPGHRRKEKCDRIRIVIADDHMLIREMLCRTLNQKDSIKIVGEAANGLQAIDVISELKPDVALLDIIMPDVDGINVLPAIREKSPKTKALMLTCLFSREMGKNRKTDSIVGILSSSQYFIVKNERLEDKLFVKSKKGFFFSKIATAI